MYGAQTNQLDSVWSARDKWEPDAEALGAGAAHTGRDAGLRRPRRCRAEAQSPPNSSLGAVQTEQSRRQCTMDECGRSD
ncbi:unnamed protein product, partial [Iphiclides podalirius]